MDFSASKCRKTPWLHKFITITDKGGDVLERCVRCGKRNVVKVYRGQVNLVDYSRHHMREFLIPQHRLFSREYKKV